MFDDVLEGEEEEKNKRKSQAEKNNVTTGRISGWSAVENDDRKGVVQRKNSVRWNRTQPKIKKYRGSGHH